MTKKIFLALSAISLAVALIIAPAKPAKAAAEDYILVNQAQDLINTAQRELNDAYGLRDAARDRVDRLRNNGASASDIDIAYRELDACNTRVSKKEDKLSKARYVLDFVNSRSSSEIFLAGMQEKFRNEASLGPMQDKINGAKAIASAQLSQINIIQDAIKSQTALAQVNPAIFEQVNQLNASYQQELLQYQQEQAEIAHLQEEYNQFAATMPMPTPEDRMKLAEIRADFEYCCNQFDQACAE